MIASDVYKILYSEPILLACIAEEIYTPTRETHQSHFCTSEMDELVQPLLSRILSQCCHPLSRNEVLSNCQSPLYRRHNQRLLGRYRSHIYFRSSNVSIRASKVSFVDLQVEVKPNSPSLFEDAASTILRHRQLQSNRSNVKGFVPFWSQQKWDRLLKGLKWSTCEWPKH